MTEAVNELELLKTQFLASLNHEIRTPLSGIMGMADLLLETPLTSEQRDYVHTARTCAENLFEILNAALEYSALSAGTVSLDESEFSFKEMLDSAVGRHEARARAKGLGLSAAIENGVPATVVGDAPRIRELLGYLIGNAVKFTAAGCIRVRAFADRTARELGIEVLDTGIGIAPERLETIFDSFRQIDAGLSRIYPGLGLGLALARKLSGLMGGRIEVSSEAGKGSSFTLRLPLRLGQGSAAYEAAQVTRPIKLLAVDDNPVGIQVLRHLLDRPNIEVHCAGSGIEAVETAAKVRCDLILMDLQMPEMNGLQAAAAIRELPGYASVPIVALTADYSDELKSLCLRRGMQAFLTKPVDAGELWPVVTKLLQT